MTEIKSIIEMLQEEDELVRTLKATPKSKSKKTEITNLKAAIRMKRCQIDRSLSSAHNYGIEADEI